MVFLVALMLNVQVLKPQIIGVPRGVLTVIDLDCVQPYSNIFKPLKRVLPSCHSSRSSGPGNPKAALTRTTPGSKNLVVEAGVCCTSR
jgi:hypothetical protein